MIWYEVRAEVPVVLATAYEAYLREEHIPDLMRTGCFVEASFCREAGGPAGGGASGVGSGGAGAAGGAPVAGEESAADAAPALRVHFRSAYLAPDRASLDRYVLEHAKRLREHALSRFPEGLRFSREEWVVRERWNAAGTEDGRPAG